MRYELIVGNVGTVLRTKNGALARVEYGRWRRESNARFGRASGEPVTLMRDGDVLFEHSPQEELCQSAT